MATKSAILEKTWCAKTALVNVKTQAYIGAKGRPLAVCDIYPRPYLSCNIEFRTFLKCPNCLTTRDAHRVSFAMIWSACLAKLASANVIVVSTGRITNAVDQIHSQNSFSISTHLFALSKTSTDCWVVSKVWWKRRMWQQKKHGLQRWHLSM